MGTWLGDHATFAIFANLLLPDRYKVMFFEVNVILKFHRKKSDASTIINNSLEGKKNIDFEEIESFHRISFFSLGYKWLDIALNSIETL